VCARFGHHASVDRAAGRDGGVLAFMSLGYESVRVVDDLVLLATKVAVADAQASGDEQLATLADLR
jgi:hypothetical protein